MVIETAAAHSMTFGITPVFAVFVGSAWLENTFIEDILNDLPELNVAASENNDKELTERFCYIIRFYAEAKQLSVIIARKCVRTIYCKTNRNPI